MKKRTDAEKLEIVRRCDSAKENGEKTGDILKEYGVNSGLLSTWRKKFRDHKNILSGMDQPDDPDLVIPDEVFDELSGEDEETETYTIKINDEYKRESVIVALVTSGYVVWQTQDSSDYFVNYQ